jgi:serine/threonine protein kinase
MFVNGMAKNYNIDLILSQDEIQKSYDLNYKIKNDWEIPPWELFIFKDRMLGEGSFSKVYLAKWREAFVVAKVINNEMLSVKKDIVLREIDIMSKLHHPNIVQFLGFVYDPFIIVIEYLPYGDLASNNSLTKTQKINIMKDILKGLSYIHNRQPDTLIHRDIKPSNILLTTSKLAKISDFGLSKFYINPNHNPNPNIKEIVVKTDLKTNIEQPKNLDNTITVGTERYMAPEVKTISSYNNKIDIYSCGILFYELFERKKYYPELPMKWYYTPKVIQTIITTQMLCEDPANRNDALSLIKKLNNYI